MINLSAKKVKKIFCSILYHMNLNLFKRYNNIDSAPIFNDENCYSVTKIDFTIDELNRIREDFKNRNYIEQKSSFKYMVFPKNEKFLNDVEMAWGFSRNYYVNLINSKLGKIIKLHMGNGNYRFEHFWMWKTPKQSSNVNSNFHTDNDMPGAMKIMIYLNDVGVKGGPFAIKNKQDDKIIKILGETGTTIIFDQNKCNHAGLPNIDTDRYVLVTTVYPTLRSKVEYEDLKPINSFCVYNPFTRVS